MTELAGACLETFSPRRRFLVCVDSDGCVFDNMGIKQTECFCPWMIAAFDLQPVAAAARECKVFADLFSQTRGANRHITLKRILTDLLPAHPQTRARGFAVPGFPHYMAWIDDPMSVLSDEGLKQAIRGAPSEQARAELKRALAWSERVNWAISEIVRGIPPFSGARMFLQDMRNTADVVVVSATPVETLRREWSEHGIAQFAALICGQESGSKRLQIQLAGNHYPKNHVIMVGDAPGDLEAARANDALFYPIVPGHEGACWEQLRAEGIDRLFSGMYAGQYETQLVARLTDALPAVPPWEKEK